MLLSYPITRDFPWRSFTPISLSAASLAIIILIVLNVALTGYETITVFQSSYSASQSFWFDHFLPTHSPALCDSHIFNVGDSFTTNYSLFQWSLETVPKPNAGRASISYTGSPLADCDVSTLYIDGDLRSWTIDFVAVIWCANEHAFEITAKTTFSFSSLAGKYSPLLGVARRPQLDLRTGDERGIVLDLLTVIASNEVGRRAYIALRNSNFTAPLAISLQVDFPPCPASLGPSAPCATSPPSFSLTNTAIVYQNLTIQQYTATLPNTFLNMPLLNDDVIPPLNNLIHLIYAALRLDLGNASPNNFLIHPNVTNATLTKSFPETPLNAGGISQLYTVWIEDKQGTPLEGLVPLSAPGTAEMQVVYLCRFQRRKGWGSLVVSVLVATLSMFSSGWAVFMLLAEYLVKRERGANVCGEKVYSYPAVE